jgi:hypothetical protein
MLPLVNKMRLFASEDLKMNAKDHEAAIAAAKERYDKYHDAYVSHKKKMWPEVESLAKKHKKTPNQAAKYHSGYPALKTLNHLRATADLEHKALQRNYENYKERRLMKKRD